MKRMDDFDIFYKVFMMTSIIVLMFVVSCA